LNLAPNFEIGNFEGKWIKFKESDLMVNMNKNQEKSLEIADTNIRKYIEWIHFPLTHAVDEILQGISLKMTKDYNIDSELDEVIDSFKRIKDEIDNLTKSFK